MSSVHQRIKWRRNIAENFNRLSRVHEPYRQTTDDRQTDGRRHIANMNMSSRSLTTAGGCSFVQVPFSDFLAGLRRSERGCCFASVEIEGSWFWFLTGKGLSRIGKNDGEVCHLFNPTLTTARTTYLLSMHCSIISTAASCKLSRLLSNRIYLQFVQIPDHPEFCC